MQRVEALLPDGSVGAEPRVELYQRFWAQPVDPPLRVVLHVHETGFSQHPQVPRDPGSGYRQQLGELADRRRVVP